MRRGTGLSTMLNGPRVRATTPWIVLGRASSCAVIVMMLTTTGTQASTSPANTETVEQAICRLVDGAAQANKLPSGFLTRLIWQESSFRTTVISPAGAQGVAQFMPGTAQERGLADPFDPEQAIPAAAALLRDHSARFGN